MEKVEHTFNAELLKLKEAEDLLTKNELDRLREIYFPKRTESELNSFKFILSAYFGE